MPNRSVHVINVRDTYARKIILLLKHPPLTRSYLLRTWLFALLSFYSLRKLNFFSVFFLSLVWASPQFLMLVFWGARMIRSLIQIWTALFVTVLLSNNCHKRKSSTFFEESWRSTDISGAEVSKRVALFFSLIARSKCRSVHM